MDRVAAERVLVVAPQLPYLVRQKRLLRQRMVRYLIGQGVDQCGVSRPHDRSCAPSTRQSTAKVAEGLFGTCCSVPGTGH